MTNQQDVGNRWIVVIGGFLGSTMCGILLYAWSVFIKPFQAEFGWNKAEIAIAFSICCAVFGVTTFFAGRLQDKFGPKIVVFIGGIIMAIGFFLTGYTESLGYLYFMYGFLAGVGGGMVYLPPIATAPKWFPDKRGLITGLNVVGLGLGSFIMAPYATALITNPEYGWRMVFFSVGVLFLVMTFPAALVLRVPPVGWTPPGWTPPVAKTGAEAATVHSFTFSEMIKTRGLWVLYIMYAGGSIAGLMVIGHLAAYGRESGLTPMEAAGAVSALAFTNAAGRVIIGWLADKFGSVPCLMGIMLVQCLIMSVLIKAGTAVVTLGIASAIIGFNYGAMFTMFPVQTGKFFGPKHMGINYGFVFTAWSVGALLGPWFGGYIFDVTGSYLVPFYFGSAVCAIAFVAGFFLKAPVYEDVKA